jgi:excisionase family DNA binding protein
MEPTKSDLLLSPTQVAAYLGISVATVIRWANTGRLPVVRSGAGHRRFYLSVVEDFRTKEDDAASRAEQHSPIREAQAAAG